MRDEAESDAEEEEVVKNQKEMMAEMREEVLEFAQKTLSSCKRQIETKAALFEEIVAKVTDEALMAQIEQDQKAYEKDREMFVERAEQAAKDFEEA